MSRVIQAQSPAIRRLRETTTLAALVLVPLVVVVIVIAPPLFGAGAVFGIAAAVLLVAQPFLLPLAIVASVPIQDLLPIPEGVPLTATRAAVAGGAGLAVFLVIAQRKSLQLHWLMLPIASFIAVMGFSLFNARDLGAGYAEIYRWTVALFSFWLVLQFVRTRSQVMFAFVLFSVLAVAQAVIGGVQAVFGFGPSSFAVTDNLYRGYGSFGMPNSYAAYMEAVTIPLIPVALWSLGVTWERFSEFRDQRLRGFEDSETARRGLIRSAALTLVLAAGAGLGLFGILISFSRGAWLATAVVLLLIVVMIGRRTIIAALSTAVASGAIVVAAGLESMLTIFTARFGQIAEQFQIQDVRGVPVTSENFAVLERMAHWQTAVAMWDEHPWLGVGAGNFDGLFREFAVHPRFIFSQGHAHNYYLHLLAETGLFGLVSYLLILGVALGVGIRAWRRPDRQVRAIGIGSVALTVALVVHNLFENLHVLNISVQILAVWAITIVALRWKQLEHQAMRSDSTLSAS